MEGVKMIKYKLTTQDMTTHNGCKWEIGKKKTIKRKGNKLCSLDVFHFYDSPEIAIILNPIHADIISPRLWEVEINEVSAHDGTKGGCKVMTLVRELPIPELSAEYRVEFAINCALSVYHAPDFAAWGKDWINGTDRSYAAARAAAEAARAARAARAAAEAAWAAAEAAAEAARAAAEAAWAAAEAASAAEDFLIQFLPKWRENVN